uniref:Uncharacterized protein n=1 Tax=Rhizophora mucronata TaxID=61149 RepID=A0A2P2NWY6_RHIMU
MSEVTKQNRKASLALKDKRDAMRPMGSLILHWLSLYWQELSTYSVWFTSSMLNTHFLEKIQNFTCIIENC